eukprot:Pgem_evm1s16660
MSLRTTVGPVGNLLDKYPEQCRRLVLQNPIITIEQLDAIKNIHEQCPGFKTKTIDITFEKAVGTRAYEPVMCVMK